MANVNFDKKLLEKIAGECETEFYNFMPRSSLGMHKWELKVRYEDGSSKLVVLCDSGFSRTGRIIEIPMFDNRKERNKIIYDLYHKEGLSQVFLGMVFRLSQSSISLIVKPK